TLSTQMPSSLFYHRSTATFSFIFQNSPTTAIYTLSHTTLFRSLLDLGHARLDLPSTGEAARRLVVVGIEHVRHRGGEHDLAHRRSEEHTSELQSRGHLVCRLLLENKIKDRQSTEHRQYRATSRQ